jgi:hypothetical protein
MHRSRVPRYRRPDHSGFRNALEGHPIRYVLFGRTANLVAHRYHHPASLHCTIDPAMRNAGMAVGTVPRQKFSPNLAKSRKFALRPTIPFLLFTIIIIQRVPLGFFLAIRAVIRNLLFTKKAELLQFLLSVLHLFKSALTWKC